MDIRNNPIDIKNNSIILKDGLTVMLNLSNKNSILEKIKELSDSIFSLQSKLITCTLLKAIIFGEYIGTFERNRFQELDIEKQNKHDNCIKLMNDIEESSQELLAKLGESNGRLGNILIKLPDDFKSIIEKISLRIQDSFIEIMIATSGMSIKLGVDARLKQREMFEKISDKEKEELIVRINKIETERNNALKSFYKNTELRNKVFNCLDI